MLKFAKANIYGACFNDVAEYICSNIFDIVGINCQFSILGLYEGKKVVACQDFVVDGYKFSPFNDLGESSIEVEKDRYRYRYADIELLIDSNKKLNDKNYAKMLFWKTYIMDALLANPDRHGKNWGFLKKNNEYFVAPVFDNGSSLFSSFSDEEEMEYVLSNADEIDERVYRTPKSLIIDDNTISDYYSIISSLKYERCNKALIELFPLINIKKIKQLIDKTDLTDVKKRFVKTIIESRYEKILKSTYLRLTNDEKN